MNFSCPRTCPMHAERWCRFRKILDAMGPVRVDSHVATIDCEIRDLDALEIACRRLGLEFRHGQQTYRWFGEFVGDAPLPKGMTAEDLGKCDHAIAVPDNDRAYEIGVRQNEDGTYTLAWDFFNGGYGLETIVGGRDSKKLVAEYSVAVAENAAKVQGWLCERTVDGGLTIFHPSGGTLTVAPGGTLDASGFVGDGCHSAMLELGMPLEAMTAKPENASVVAQAQVIGR